MRLMNRMADRLLEMVAPHTVARAADCDYQCGASAGCGPKPAGAYCCYYPNGTTHCGACQRLSLCTA
ncbi:hypothetical protein [Streptomyces sp. NBC_01198]|jgi:hypothetical protein|uniref:hypothetical protein n=1 Tax=Streptomyces sp. NBC_01198 TaxID=2903769 RepID=UPI002E15EF20|nr:hypothetical protein OG702_31775 [Streptomyces sp. NBC_01198]